MMNDESTLKVLRFSELVKLGIINNRMTLRRWIESGHFPAPIRLGSNSIAWRFPRIFIDCQNFISGQELFFAHVPPQVGQRTGS